MTRPTLNPDSFHILIALAEGERHGYAIMQEIAERTAGKVQLSPSSLYSAIKRLLEAGLIQELGERPDPDCDDERRRYYRVTKAGRRVAIGEARHLKLILAQARGAGLVPGSSERKRSRTNVRGAQIHAEIAAHLSRIARTPD